VYAQLRPSHRRFVFSVSTVLIGALVAACGDSKRAPEAETPTRDLEEALGVVLIENAEDGDATLLQDEELGIIGYWYSYDDRQECVHPDFEDMLTATCGTNACAASGGDMPTDPPPAPYGGTFVTKKYAEAGTTGPGKEGKQKANEGGIRLTGGGHIYFGAGVGVALNNPGTMQPYDLAAQGFTGVRFLAKSGDGNPIKLRVKIKDAFSEPEGDNCDVRQNVCSPAGCECCDETGMTCAPNVLQGCHDDPLAPAALTAVTSGDWEIYEIPFSAFVREGWGTHEKGMEPPSDALDATQAYQLQFQVQTDMTPANMPLAPFDLWLDNIGFTTGEPAGPPAGNPPEPASTE
jgi:hypothetical protein